MSQHARSRKLVSLLSKRYFRHHMKIMSNIKYSDESATARCKNEDAGDINDCIFESHQEDNTADYNNMEPNSKGNTEDDSELNFYNMNVCEVANFVDDLNIGKVENIGMEDDFTPTHLARWCTTLNVPKTHANVLLKGIRKLVTMQHQDTTSEQISSIAAEWLKHAKQRVHRQSEKGKKHGEAMPPLCSANSEMEDP